MLSSRPALDTLLELLELQTKGYPEDRNLGDGPY